MESQSSAHEEVGAGKLAWLYLQYFICKARITGRKKGLCV